LLCGGVTLCVRATPQKVRVMDSRPMRLPAVGVLLVVALALVAGSAAKAPGGETTGASPSWRPLPRSPIAGRIAASAVWTGKEVIVWGGVSAGQPRSDGAAYNPASRTWRRIARSPAGVIGDGGRAAAWTGKGMVVWAGNSPDGPAGGAVYDPRTDTWRRLPNSPLGSRENYVSAWTGKELLIFGGNRGDTLATPSAAAVNPRTGSWRVLKALAAVKGLIANGAVWNGREAFVSGTVRRYPTVIRPIFFAFDPATGTLRRISLAKAPVDTEERGQLNPIAWTGTEVVFSSSADPLFASTSIVLYNPTTGAWKKPGAAPCTLPTKGYTQIAWIGDRLVVPCGTNGLQIYNPRTDGWRTLQPGPSPLNSRGWSAIVWTGRSLIVWSGTVKKPENPTPADGSSITLKG